MESHLRGLGCEKDDDPRPLLDMRGEWWKSGWGAPFFLHWADNDGGVDQDVFGRLLSALLRARFRINLIN